MWNFKQFFYNFTLYVTHVDTCLYSDNLVIIRAHILWFVIYSFFINIKIIPLSLDFIFRVLLVLWIRKQESYNWCLSWRIKRELFLWSIQSSHTQYNFSKSIGSTILISYFFYYNLSTFILNLGQSMRCNKMNITTNKIKIHRFRHESIY